MTAPGTALKQAITAELNRPAPPAVLALAAELRRTHGPAIAAILFYGSCRRTNDMASLLDLTVLHNGHRAYQGHLLPALFNALLPPNVGLVTAHHAGQQLRAKVAVLSMAQFRQRMRPTGLDTSVWARFCQPASLLYAANDAARGAVTHAIAQAIATAALWAVRLGPPSATQAAYWTSLFRNTYSVELRPERPGRAAMLHDQNAAWFSAILPPALHQQGIDPQADATGRLHPHIPARLVAARIAGALAHWPHAEHTAPGQGRLHLRRRGRLRRLEDRTPRRHPPGA